jgi:hypothetical protein
MTVDFDDLRRRFEADVMSRSDGDISDTARYLRYKAFVYQELGPELYRSSDAFGFPAPSATDRQLAMFDLGSRQLLQGLGVSPESPLEHLQILDLRDLLGLFHFRCDFDAAGPAANGTAVKLRALHAVHGTELDVFAVVPRARHRLAGVDFPPLSQGFFRGDATHYDETGYNIGVAYGGRGELEGVQTTLFVFPGRGDTLADEAIRLLAEMRHAYPSIRELHRKPIRISAEDGISLLVEIPGKEPAGPDRVLSWAFLFASGGWLVKYRCTSWSGVSAAKVEPALEHLAGAVGFPLSDNQLASRWANGLAASRATIGQLRTRHLIDGDVVAAVEECLAEEENGGDVSSLEIALRAYQPDAVHLAGGTGVSVQSPVRLSGARSYAEYAAGIHCYLACVLGTRGVEWGLTSIEIACADSVFCEIASVIFEDGHRSAVVFAQEPAEAAPEATADGVLGTLTFVRDYEGEARGLPSPGAGLRGECSVDESCGPAAATVIERLMAHTAINLAKGGG